MTKHSPTRPTPRKRRPLTPRQARFVAEYLVDLNSTQAAIRAGYAAQWADNNATHLNEEGLIRTATTHGRGRLPVRADKPC